MRSDPNGNPAARPVDRSRPCWTCHWYAYSSALQGACGCVNPACSGMRAQPEQGCSAWMREIGADDVPGDSWSPLIDGQEPGPAQLAAARLERARLERIEQLALRAPLPPYVYARVSSRTGLLELDHPARQLRPDEHAAAVAEIERTGVNAAIRAGRL